MILEYVRMFFADARVSTIAGLILLDILLAVAAAVKSGLFDWRKLAAFYQTMVVPYILGYLAIYLAANLISVELLGEMKDVVGEVAIWMAWASIVGNLVADIIRSGKALGYAWGLEKGGG